VAAGTPDGEENLYRSIRPSWPSRRPPGILLAVAGGFDAYREAFAIGSALPDALPDALPGLFRGVDG
jgi:hypothetical protein